MNTVRRNAISILVPLLCIALTLNQTAFAAQAVPAPQAAPPAPPTSAPVPSQIAAARSVFVVNSGTDPNFPIDSTQAYNDVYAALKAWGHFQLVASPDQADLVFNLHGVAPITGIYGDDHTGVRSYTSPAFQLTIVEPRSNTPLWTITSPVNIAGRKAARARWTDLAVTNLISRIKVLSNQPLTPTESADLTTVPNSHAVRNTVLLVGGLAAVAVGTALLVHHEFENSVAKDKQSQDAFCAANNIPLSECAGG